jgi:hypothetical protein
MQEYGDEPFYDRIPEYFIFDPNQLLLDFRGTFICDEGSNCDREYYCQAYEYGRV